MVNFINIGQDENLEDVISTMSDTLLNSRWFKITYFHKGLGEEVTRYGRFNNQFIGRSIYNQSVFVNSKKNLIGKILNIKIIRSTDFALEGEI